MTGIAWDKIIGAAAQSTLGILSLGIILVGVLAYLFFGKSDDRVKLGVFAGILLAVIGLGIAILRESQVAGADSSAQSSATAAPGVTPTPGGTSAPEPTRSPEPGGDQAAASSPDIAGLWKDTDGFTYRFRVSGDRVSYTQFKGAEGSGSIAGSGSGTISGRKLQYAYVDNSTGDRGQCSAEVAPDGASIEGRCTSGGSRWSFRIDRAG